MDGISAKIKKDIINYIPANIVPMIIGIVSMYIYTTYISAKEFGTYNILSGNVAIAVMLVYEWISHGIMRYYPYYKEKGKVEVISDTLLILLGSITSILIICSGIVFKIWSFSYFISIYLILTEGLNLIINAMVRTQLKSNVYLRISIIKSVGYFILSMCMLYILKGDIVSLLISKIIINIIIIIITIRGSNSKIEILKSRKDDVWVCTKKLFIYGAPIILTGFMSKCLQISDRYFVDFYWGKEAVAMYTSNYMINDNVINILFTPIMMTTHNLLIKLFEENKIDDVKEMLCKVKKTILVLFIPIIIFIIFFYKNVTSVFISKEYIGSSYILPFVIIGTFFFNYSLYNYKILELERNTHKITIAISISFIINIILNILLIKTWGIFGAAISTLVSYLVFFLISVKVQRKRKFINKIGLGFWKKYIPTISIITVFWIIIKILTRWLKLDNYITNMIYTASISGTTYIIYILVCYKKLKILKF